MIKKSQSACIGFNEKDGNITHQNKSHVHCSPFLHLMNQWYQFEHQTVCQRKKMENMNSLYCWIICWNLNSIPSHYKFSSSSNSLILKDLNLILILSPSSDKVELSTRFVRNSKIGFWPALVCTQVIES